MDDDKPKIRLDPTQRTARASQVREPDDDRDVCYLDTLPVGKTLLVRNDVRVPIDIYTQRVERGDAHLLDAHREEFLAECVKNNMDEATAKECLADFERDHARDPS